MSLKERLVNFFKKYREIISYIFFGVLTTVVSLVVFRLCGVVLGEENYLISNIISWVAAVLFAYVTNKLWVFNSDSSEKKSIFRELVGFFGARLFSLAVEEAGLWLMVDVMSVGKARLELFGIAVGGDMLAKLVMQLVVVVLNYVFSKFLIFAKGRK